MYVTCISDSKVSWLTKQSGVMKACSEHVHKYVCNMSSKGCPAITCAALLERAFELVVMLCGLLADVRC
jgi:hypothetical protein